MIKALLFDFAKVLLFNKDRNYHGGLNDLNNLLSKKNPDYSFLAAFELNTELLNFLEKIKTKIPVYMFTSETIQERPEVAGEIVKVFSKIYSAKKIGIAKTNPEAYKFIAKDLNLLPEEILFVDDNNTNVQAAILAGMKVVQYKDNSQILLYLKEMLGLKTI